MINYYYYYYSTFVSSSIHTTNTNTSTNTSTYEYNSNPTCIGALSSRWQIHIQKLYASYAFKFSQNGMHPSKSAQGEILILRIIFNSEYFFYYYLTAGPELLKTIY